jgi:hypothetical protein
MNEYTPDREIGTRCRAVELVGSNSADDANEQRAELVKLVEDLHRFSFRQGSSIVDRAALGNGEFSGFPVAAESDEPRDAA